MFEIDFERKTSSLTWDDIKNTCGLYLIEDRKEKKMSILLTSDLTEYVFYFGAGERVHGFDGKSELSRNNEWHFDSQYKIHGRISEMTFTDIKLE